MEGKIYNTKSSFNDILLNSIENYKRAYPDIPVVTSYHELPENSIRDGRRQGNTTRLIDNTIDLLHKGYIVKVRDHHSSDEANKYLLKKIEHRLNDEHKISKENILIDRMRYAIMLKPELWSK